MIKFQVNIFSHENSRVENENPSNGLPEVALACRTLCPAANL